MMLSILPLPSKGLKSASPFGQENPGHTIPQSTCRCCAKISRCPTYPRPSLSAHQKSNSFRVHGNPCQHQAVSATTMTERPCRTARKSNCKGLEIPADMALLAHPVNIVTTTGREDEQAYPPGSSTPLLVGRKIQFFAHFTTTTGRAQAP